MTSIATTSADSAKPAAPAGADAAPGRPALRLVEKPAPDPAAPNPDAAKAAAKAAALTRATESSDRSWRIVLSITVLSVLAAFVVGRSGWYTPGDDIGYYTGLAGGVLMLLLLLYPLRKYVKAFRNWGAVKYWFAVHMVMGIGGPVLVLAHSTFHMRSTNAAVALICMLVVAGSGIIGRFLYVKVHRGLYGEKLSLQELQSVAGFENREVRSRLFFVPEVERRIRDFEAYAMPEYRSFLRDVRRFLWIGVRRMIVYGRCRAQIVDVLGQRARARHWDQAKLRRRVRRSCKLVNEYLGTAQRVSQFTVYDNLLKLWHVAHVPLVYLLVLSGIAHVVAVHMY